MTKVKSMDCFIGSVYIIAYQLEATHSNSNRWTVRWVPSKIFYHESKIFSYYLMSAPPTEVRVLKLLLTDVAVQAKGQEDRRMLDVNLPKITDIRAFDFY